MNDIDRDPDGIGQAPVLIAGGGIGGCAAALALAQRGIPVQLFEKAADFGEVGAGIQLGPNAFRAFDALGITEQVKGLVARPDHLVMRDGTTAEVVTSMRAGEPFEARFGHPYALVYRPDLHGVLVDACKAHKLVQMRTQQRITRYEDDRAGARVHTEDGKLHAGRAVIGADGLWSQVRAQMLDEGKPRVSGHIAYRAVLPTEQVPLELRFNDMVLWAGPRFHLVQYPLRRGELYNLVAVFHSNRYEEGWNSFGDTEELMLRFADACPQVKTLLGRIDTWRMWVLCDRDPIAHWSQGRVALLGDAAHPMLQYMAQGACMALEDAVCLADELAGAGSDVPAALTRYWQRRYLRTARVQLTARLYGEVYHARGATRDLRNQVLQQRTEAQAYESLAWLYEPLPTQA